MLQVRPLSLFLHLAAPPGISHAHSYRSETLPGKKQAYGGKFTGALIKVLLLISPDNLTPFLT